MANKRGALADTERKFIEENREKMTVDQMAEALNRSSETVQKALYKLEGSFKQEAVAQEFLNDLKTRPYWANLVKQYSDAELQIYQYHWVKYNEQFQEGKTHAEESQILKVIDLEIMLERLKLEHNSLIHTIEALQEELDNQIAVPLDERTDQDKAMIMSLNNQIMGARAAIGNAQKSYNEVLDKHTKLMVSLKSTRDQRLKDVETKDVTMFGWLKALGDRKIRETISKDAEMMKLAMGNLKQKLGEYHKYEDGEVDRPLLNHETVQGDEEDESGTV